MLRVGNASGWMQSCAAPVADHLDKYPGQPSGVDASYGCTFDYWSLPRLDRVGPVTGPLSGNTSVTLEGAFFDGSGRFFALFGADYVECASLSATSAVCPTPPFAGSRGAFGGARVDIQVQLEESIAGRLTN